MLDLDNCICTDPSEIALGGGLAAGTKWVTHNNIVGAVFASLGACLASIAPEQGAIMYPRIGEYLLEKGFNVVFSPSINKRSYPKRIASMMLIIQDYCIILSKPSI